LIIFNKVNKVILSIKYGNSKESINAYAAYSAILCGIGKDINAGY